MQEFRNLKVWQKSHQLTLKVYQLTQLFPVEERYGLTSQIRRASISIPTNIAEGCGREGSKELSRFLQIALGSAMEVEYLILFCRDIKLCSAEIYDSLQQEVSEIKKMLTSFIKKLKTES